MAKAINFLVVLSLLALAPALCFSLNTLGTGYLYPQFYDRSCPRAQQIVKSVVAKAVTKEARMAASLLRLHFHDCFVKGCDASILIDSTGSIISEKRSNPNRNSARGFEVIDEIKSALEKECPHTVSCADIMALAARDSTVFTDGPSWEVPLGRRDSLGASLSGSNNNIPAPNNTFQTILTKFKLKGLDIVILWHYQVATALETQDVPASGKGYTIKQEPHNLISPWINPMHPSCEQGVLIGWRSESVSLGFCDPNKVR